MLYFATFLCASMLEQDENLIRPTWESMVHNLWFHSLFTFSEMIRNTCKQQWILLLSTKWWLWSRDRHKPLGYVVFLLLASKLKSKVERLYWSVVSLWKLQVSIFIPSCTNWPWFWSWWSFSWLAARCQLQRSWHLKRATKSLLPRDLLCYLRVETRKILLCFKPRSLNNMFTQWAHLILYFKLFTQKHMCD